VIGEALFPIFDFPLCVVVFPRDAERKLVAGLGGDSEDTCTKKVCGHNSRASFP